MSVGNKAITPQLTEKIEAARRRLQQASAVLKCLTVAFNEEAEIDFGDVAMTAYDVIDAVIDSLDVVMLERADGKQRV